MPRSTLDIDLLIEASEANAAALLAALRDSGLGTACLIEPCDLLRMGVVVFEDVLRVDVQARTPGLVFEDAWERRRTETLDGVPVSLVSRDDLIASKEAAGRPIDLEDVRALRQAACRPQQ